MSEEEEKGSLGKDLKHLGLIVMAALLTTTAPQWLSSGAEKRASNYSAPWIYPAQMPKQ